MEIGLFQLENLTLTFMPFVFFDLRAKRAPVHPEIDVVLKRAEGVGPDQARARLSQLEVPKSVPIVLVCGTGVESRRVATALERDGFEQIYVVENGVAGLLAEIEA